MRFYFIISVIIASINVSHSKFILDAQLSHPRYGTVNNVNLEVEADCALRAFAVEMATYIQPNSSISNWTALSESALQMHECNVSYGAYEPSTTTKPFEQVPDMVKEGCVRTVFVDDRNGNDSSNGTFDRPMKTIQAALSLTRTLRTAYGNGNVLCITIRAGTYYLGTNATTTSSQIGAIALTTIDNSLVIENYQNERVVLSGGTLLQMQWSIHTQTPNGTIMKAQIPSSVNLEQFNELYIDGRRAIVAKYPNGDPSTRGLYARPSGFTNDARDWYEPDLNPSVDIVVQEPFRNNTAFPYYQIGVGGGASVFNPPSNFWSTASPPQGEHYRVPRGVIVKTGGLPHMRNWTKPTTGLVHTFHSGHWGSWVFEIASINVTENTIMFGRGGFQEARGRKSGAEYYIANIFEELDSPNEWFLDKDSRTLYFMSNDTMPEIFVASQVSSLISMSGSSIEDPVQNILIQGLTLTHTSNTYLKDYMVPSGGDWSVHRGGTIYLTNTENVTITHNFFTQLGSNGIAVIDYNNATAITSNEFVWLADSGIILVGSTNGIDGFSVASQPSNTLIKSNIIHETGIYIKQSSPVLIAVSRSTSVIGNLMFNIPRAAININDGFYGNHTLSYNVLFNAVRETRDHGPINTWDRQPYLTDAIQSGVPSLWGHMSYIHHNLILDNYNTLYPIDHDDGSSFYEDSYNFQIYGGMKSYLGHSKIDHHQMYVYPDLHNDGCLHEYHPSPNVSGWNESWIQNTCILYKARVPYKFAYCNASDLFLSHFADNKIYTARGVEVGFECIVNGTEKTLSLEEWQALGMDLGTTAQTAPDIQTIIQWGRAMLQVPT